MSQFKFPSFIVPVNDIVSSNLSPLLKMDNPIEYLREIYTDDKLLFFKIIDELKLRGIALVSNEPNPLLPGEVLEGPRIAVSEDGKKFEDIDFELLKLSNIVNRFSIESDFFFNGVPLKGFQQLNRSLKLSTVYEVFKNLGFQILGFQELSHNIVDGFQKDRRLISEVFSESQFISFLKYSKRKKLVYISDIKENHIAEYRMQYGVGVKKYNNFLDKWKMVNTEYGNYRYDVLGLKEKPFEFKHPTPISVAFKGNKFRLFVNFCEKNEVECLTELNREIIRKYSKVNGVGVKKIRDVEQRIDELLVDERLQLEKLNSTITSFDIYPLIKEITIKELLDSLKLDAGFDLNLDELGEKVDYIDSLPENIQKSIKRKLVNLLPISKIAELIRSSIPQNALELLEIRSHGATLEIIGKKLGVTRERARQILNKIINKLSIKLMEHNFYTTLKLVKGNTFGLTKAMLEELLGKNNDFIIAYLKVDKNQFEYMPEINLFVTQKEKNILLDISNKLHECPDYLSVEAFTKKVKEILEDHSIQEYDDTLNYILKFMSWNRVGDYVSKGSITLTKKLEILFQHHLNEPILLDESGKEKIEQKCEEVFGERMGGTLRALEGRIRNVENIILVDQLTFQWINESLLEEEVFEDIEIYINQKLHERIHINAEEIYLAFKNELHSIGISNKIHLYSLVKYFFENQYEIGKGNTLNIYRKGERPQSVEERVKKLLRSENQYTITELSKKLNYRLSTLQLVISRNPELILGDNGIVKLRSSIGLSEDDSYKLISFILKNMPDGYSTTNRLYQECLLDDEMSKLLKKYVISTEYDLGSLLKKIEPTIKGHSLFLYKENSNIRNFEEAVKLKFPYETTRDKIMKFILSYGYSEGSCHQILYNLINNNEFVPIDTDLLHNRRNLIIDDEVRGAVRNFLEDELTNKDYLVISELVGIRKKLPPIDYRWTPRLLHTIAIDLGFKHIKSIDDYRYDRLIIVEQDSYINGIEQIVTNEIENNMLFHTDELTKHLKKIGLLHPNKRSLPFDMVNNRYFTIDEFGRIKLKDRKVRGDKLA